jgi:hypothetical protein
MAAGRQAFSLVTWTSSDHTISLWRQVTQMLLLWTILLWWRSAISNHSVLIFRRSLLPRHSDHQISVVCQVWTKSKSSCWNIKENNEFTLQKNIPRQLKKRKSSRAINPKRDGLRRMLLLAFQKDGREGFAGIEIRLTLQIRTPN